MPPKRGAPAREEKKKAPSRAQILAEVAARSGVHKAHVVQVLDALDEVLVQALREHKAFTLNDLLKLKVAPKPATQERKGRNPKTGEEITIKARPASEALKVRVMKKLKDRVL